MKRTTDKRVAFGQLINLLNCSGLVLNAGFNPAPLDAAA
jgi:hypothetical protein